MPAFLVLGSGSSSFGVTFLAVNNSSCPKASAKFNELKLSKNLLLENLIRSKLDCELSFFITFSINFICFSDCFLRLISVKSIFEISVISILYFVSISSKNEEIKFVFSF